MSPEVLKRKLQKLIQYLNDLKKHEGSSFETFMENHYEVERILELLIETSSDLIFHELSKKELTPDSYREAFLMAGEKKIISKELAKNLALKLPFAILFNFLLFLKQKAELLLEKGKLYG